VISVVIPSLGRKTLPLAVKSCGSAEVIVVFDGQEAADRAPSLPGWVRVLVTEPSGGRWGSPQRTLGMREASGRWVAFMDDDDVFLPGAVRFIRKHSAGDRLTVYRVKHTGTVVWETNLPGVRHGNVSTLGLVVPRRKEIPDWPDGPGADCLFATACRDQLGEPLWVDRVVAKCVKSHGGLYHEGD
jgi:glycosyltransferase involved in cell wall biosynthesis